MKDKREQYLKRIGSGSVVTVFGVTEIRPKRKSKAGSRAYRKQLATTQSRLTNSTVKGVVMTGDSIGQFAPDAGRGLKPDHASRARDISMLTDHLGNKVTLVRPHTFG